MRHMSGPFRPSIVRQTATPRPRSDHLLHVPSAIHPSFQPLHNHFPNHPTTTPTITKPRLNHPSCRIQERFRRNHHTSTILTTLSCMALARPSTVLSKSEDSHLHLKVMIWYNMFRQWRKPKSPAGGEVSADGEEKSSPLTLKTMCGDE